MSPPVSHLSLSSTPPLSAGAYSLLNPEWKRIVERDGIPSPDHLQWFDGWDDTIV